MKTQSLTDLLFQLQRSAKLLHRGRGGPHGPRGHMGAPMRPDAPPAGPDMPAMRGQALLLEMLLGEDDLPLKDLVEKMDIRPSSLSELVQKLQRAGLVETREDAQDRRSTRVKLTEEGRARAQERLSAREEKLGALFAGLTEEEQGQLLALLTKLNQSLESKGEQEEASPPEPEWPPHGHGPHHGCPHGAGPWGPRERMRGHGPRRKAPEDIVDLEY